MSETRLLASARNLAEWPWASLDDRLHHEIAIYEDTISHGGELLTRRITVRPALGLGLPTASDELIFLGILELARRDRFTSATVEFSGREMLRLIGWDISGRYQELLRCGLMRLKGVTIEARRAWYHPVQGWTDLTFSLVDLVVSPNENPDSKGYRVTLSSPLIESARAGYVGTLRLDICREVGVVARRLYAYLDRAFLDGKKCYSIGLLKLTRSRLGMNETGYPHPCDALKKLQLAHNQLINHGVIRSATIRGSRWEAIVDYRRGPDPQSTPDHIRLLGEVGIHGRKAEQILSEFDWVLIQPHIAALKAQRTKVQNPPNWLRASISGNFVHKGNGISHVATANEPMSSCSILEEPRREDDLPDAAIDDLLHNLPPEVYAVLESQAVAAIWPGRSCPTHPAAVRRLRKRMAQRVAADGACS